MNNVKIKDFKVRVIKDYKHSVLDSATNILKQFVVPKHTLLHVELMGSKLVQNNIYSRFTFEGNTITIFDDISNCKDHSDYFTSSIKE